MIQRWQYTIGGSSRVVSSSICGGNDFFTTAVRPLPLNSTSTLQQNYNDAPSLQHVITRSNLIKQSHIYPQHYQRRISNNIIHNCNANNQLRWFTSGGRHTHHGGRCRGNYQGRGHQSTNRIPMMKEFNTLD